MELAESAPEKRDGRVHECSFVAETLGPIIGTPLCEHAHVAFLARGHIRGEYEDGCEFEFVAPTAVVIEPGHDAWVVGDEPAVLIQFDYEGDTARRFDLPERHSH